MKKMNNVCKLHLQTLFKYALIWIHIIKRRYPAILSKQFKIDKQIKSIKKQLKTCPPGKLVCAKNGKYQKWYHSDGHHKVYIPKKNRKLAENLAIKKYLLLLLDDLEKEKQAIDSYLKSTSNSKKSEHLLIKSSEYQALLKPYFSPITKELSEWVNASYEKNSYHAEHLIHTCASGNVVRSKSESMIDSALYIHQIPFRYECVLTLGDTTIYPDFTIRHPKTGDIYYWEHFGMIDNPNYSKNAFTKIQLYANHGIYPSIQLITTFETKQNPLSTETINKIIEAYFLS